MLRIVSAPHVPNFRWVQMGLDAQAPKHFQYNQKHYLAQNTAVLSILYQTFDTHTNASDLQLGVVISQNKKPIAFYRRKLNPAQTRYTTTEK